MLWYHCGELNVYWLLSFRYLLSSRRLQKLRCLSKKFVFQSWLQRVFFCLCHIIKHVYLNELQLEVFGHLVVLANTENVGDDVVLRVSLVPEGLEDLVSLVNLALHTIAKHLLDQQGMRLITHLKKSTSSLGLKMYTHYMYVASVVI